MSFVLAHPIASPSSEAQIAHTDNKLSDFRRWSLGKLAVLDISESGKTIAQKLFALLSVEQRQELVLYAQTEAGNSDASTQTTLSPAVATPDPKRELLEIQTGGLYFCLENRVVRVDGKDITLTAKEFDIFALLIKNPDRVFTFEAITDEVWRENADVYSRKSINNHICNLRKKLRISPQTPDYILNIHGIGYKFNSITGTL